MRKTVKVLLSTITAENSNSSVQIALYYLKSYFKKHSFCKQPVVNMDIEVYIAQQNALKIAKDIIGRKYTIVGFSCYIWNITKILKVARIIKRHNPYFQIILGGPEVSPRHEEILQKEKAIDIIVRGEGEAVFKELIESLVDRNKDLSAIKGISYRRGNSVFVNPTRTPVSYLDSIPSPYLEGMIKVQKDCLVPLETMRGCLYKCHYCYEHKDLGAVRYFSIKRIERELKYILTKKPKQVSFLDPTFNADLHRAKKVLRLFIKYNRSSILHAALRAELLDEEMVRLLRRAKAALIEIGVQTTHPASLRRINRSLEWDIFKNNVTLLRKEKVFSSLQLIAGLPGETYEDLKNSLDQLCQLRPSQVVIFRLMALPGTYIREKAKELGMSCDLQPPYFINKNDTMSERNLKKVDNLSASLNLLYNSRLLRNTIVVLAKKLGIKFSDIFEEWYKWNRRFKLYWLLSNLQASGGITNPQRLKILNDKFAPRFIKHLCNKYADSSVYQEIYPLLRKDLVIFFMRTNIQKGSLPHYSRRTTA